MPTLDSADLYQGFKPETNTHIVMQLGHHCDSRCCTHKEQVFHMTMGGKNLVLLPYYYLSPKSWLLYLVLKATTGNL